MKGIRFLRQCGRQRPRLRSAVPLATLLAAAGAIAGCSGSINIGSGTTTVEQTDASSAARRFVSQQLRDLPPPQAIDCPSDIAAKVGTTFVCRATLMNGQEVTIPLRVASVAGDHARLRSDPAVVDQALAVDVVYKAAEAPVKSVDCPTDVKASVGQTVKCRLNFKGGKQDAIVLKLERDSPSGNQDLRVIHVRAL